MSTRYLTGDSDPAARFLTAWEGYWRRLIQTTEPEAQLRLMEEHSRGLDSIVDNAEAGEVSREFARELRAEAGRLRRPAGAAGNPVLVGNLQRDLQVDLAKSRCVEVARAAVSRLAEMMPLSPADRLRRTLSLYFSRAVQVACEVDPRFIVGAFLLVTATASLSYLSMRPGSSNQETA